VTTRALNIPNALSLSRVPLAAAFVLTESATWRAIIIVTAAASDYMDGWWARERRVQPTRLGAILDPVTDRLFVLTALIVFAVERIATWQQLLLLLLRDIIVTAGALLFVALRGRIEIKARYPGKVVTTLQLTAMLALLLMPGVAMVVVVATAAASLWAIVDYTRIALVALRPPPQPR
jgi:CDP-diacylglycerol--glycerol-3-phosphate 3-phosphatidyltransferase/cardiolipin synthase